jgi:hypothetical protein
MDDELLQLHNKVPELPDGALQILTSFLEHLDLLREFSYQNLF